jgi:hypothetical protein
LFREEGSGNKNDLKSGARAASSQPSLNGIAKGCGGSHAEAPGGFRHRGLGKLPLSVDDVQPARTERAPAPAVPGTLEIVVLKKMRSCAAAP